MHNIYQYLNNPVETFFFFFMKKYTLDGCLHWESGSGGVGGGSKKVHSVRALQDSYVQHQILEVSSPWVSTVREKWTHQNCSIKYGHKKLLSSSPMQAHHAGWVGSPMLDLLRPGASPSPAPPSGSHLQSRSLASSVPCCHSGGPGSPLSSDSCDPRRRRKETTERGRCQTCQGQQTWVFRIKFTVLFPEKGSNVLV